MTTHGRTAAKNPTVHALAALAGLTISCLPATIPSLANAQPAASAPASPAFSGQDFAGQRFPLATVTGPISFKATKAWAWRQGDARRLILSGDVVVVLGTYKFIAKTAAVWLQELTPAGQQPATYQIFVAFDHVGDPQEANSFGIAADRLPVKAVITPDTKLELACDAIFDGPPSSKHESQAAFTKEAEGMLAQSLSRLVDPNAGRVAVAPPPFVKQLRWLNPPAKPVAPVPPPVVVATKPSNATDTQTSSRAALRDPPNRSGNAAAPAGATAAAAAASQTPAATTPTTGATAPAATAAAATSGSGSTPAAATGPAVVPAATAAATPAPTTRLAPELPADAQTLFAKDGIVTLSAKGLSVVSAADETSVVADSGVVVQYSDLRSGRVLQLTAQRAVVFLDPVKLTDAASLAVENIRGMYLEGDVIATDGKFTLRGPQIYYDVRNNNAVMLDAVFWTYDEKRQLPLYVRAKSIKQTAADQFVATKATLTNTAMLDPELSIGVSSVTITRRQEATEQSPLERGTPAATVSTTTVQADNVTVRAGGVPIFYWPRYSGDPAMMPIRDLRVENRSGSGVAVKATFNAYSLLGLKKPADSRFDLMTDYYFERGPALGTRLGWNNPDSRGGLMAYMVPTDTGTDLLKPGTKIDRDDEFRGAIAGDQRWQLDDAWSVFLEGSYISDETFIDAFFEDQGETRREFTNRIRADRTERNTQFSLEGKGTFNDFIANEWLLQSQGYSVSKLPEATYTRQADDLLNETHPGLLSYWSEYRVGALQLAFDEIDPAKRGFGSTALSQRAFGLDPTQSYGDRFRALGLSEDTVYRADTRQEVSLNAEIGRVRVQPFVQGRLTAYDNSFEQYSPDEDDSTRLQGAAGIRASTSFERIYDGVDSSLLDVHRLRHIIEPNMTVWHSGTTVNSASLPVYDPTVEALADGTIMRFGATQTLQTQRGTPGRWHNTDLVVLNTDFVVSSGNAERTTPIGRIFDYRPEYANPGNYFVGDVVYRITDATALTGSTVFDFDDSQQAMSTAGVIIQHAPEFSTFGDVRFINELDSTYLNMGASYEFTTKYTATIAAAYDLDLGGFQTTDFEIRRKFASMLFGVNLGFNDITGETSFGFVLRPYGTGGEVRSSGSSRGSEFGS
jgi:hypothetical protein